jgi:serine/threonine protein kinase
MIASMCVKEAQTMFEMKHDRVVEFIDLDIENISLIMELMPGGSLRKYIDINKYQMSWDERYQMLIDICDGMEFLHAAAYASGETKLEVFHQDLKTANVLLCTTDGKLRAKISDFNLARKLLF